MDGSEKDESCEIENVGIEGTGDSRDIAIDEENFPLYGH
jgi:hypothetical protein